VFDSALTSSDVIDYILVIGDAVDIGTPSDGTVGTAQMNYPLGNFSSTGIDDNADAVAITIDSSEQVGIGTTSPSSYYAKNLVVSAGSEGGVTIASTNTTNNNYLHFADGTSGDASYRGQIGYAHNGDQLSVSSSGSTVFNSGSSRVERLRIDSAGALQIGGTTNAGFLDFDGTSLQLNTQRNPNTGAFVNTSKAHAGVTLSSASGNGHVKFYASSANNTTASERARVTADGLTFNGDTAASNALDDYEEGTWTPTLIGYGQSTPASQTYSSQEGHYVKIGRLVVASYAVQLSNKGNMSGNYVLLSGWPFSRESANFDCGIANFLNMSTSVNSMWWELTNSYGWLSYISTSGNTTAQYMTVSGLNNNTRFSGSVAYLIP
jgi:hypothetical protein|tara:strand:- start:184 stop:1320 length:1137 start_codon:yes stop_codon:yes gene_type:complete